MSEKETATAETTSIEQVDIDLDSLDFLGTPGAENVMLPEEQKPSVFSRNSVDLSFIDKDSSDDKGETKEPEVKIDDVIQEVDPDSDFRLKAESKVNETAEAKAGRPKVEKNGMAEDDYRKVLALSPDYVLAKEGLKRLGKK